MVIGWGFWFEIDHHGEEEWILILKKKTAYSSSVLWK